MKSLTLAFVFIIANLNISAQDTCDKIVTNNGDTTLAKVTEIGVTEIKYKKCENIDGPTYVLTKSEVERIIYLNGTIEKYNDVEINTQKCEIYFLRRTGYSGSGGGYGVFVDGNFACKLNNKKYIVYEVDPGVHYCSAQFYGKESKDNAEKLKVTTEAGKKYYISVTQEVGLVTSNVYCEEISEDSAKQKIEQGLKLDSNCK